MYIQQDKFQVTFFVLFLSVINVNIFCSVDGAGTSPYPGAGGCSNNSVSLVTQNDPCPRQYLRCEGGKWHRAMCAGGIINQENGECVPYSNECPSPGLTARTYTIRTRRQTAAVDNCLRSYMCPTDLTSIFIYPDWTNTDCDSYIVCAAGNLLLSSCRRDNYNYYNPRRLSCEEFPSTTNICVFRENADLSPAFPI